METQGASLALARWSLWLLLLGLVLPSASAQALSYRKAVLRAVDQFNERSSEANLYRLLELDATPNDEVDPGTRKPVSFTVKETVCPKTAQQPLEQCEFKENGALSYREAVLHTGDCINDGSTEANLYRLLELDPPPEQDVEDRGARKPLSFTVKETVCPRTSQQPPEQCDFKENGLVKQCVGTASLDRSDDQFDLNCNEVSGPFCDENPNVPKPVSFRVKETVCPRTSQQSPEQCDFKENGLVKQCVGTVTLDQSNDQFDLNCNEVEDRSARKPVSFRVKETMCPRSSLQPPEQCDFKENGLVKKCVGTVSLDQIDDQFDLNWSNEVSGPFCVVQMLTRWVVELPLDQ
ncbi:hypothetical protein G4228_016125 [Cervus hanglu yarkandensis]|nr:hypothetical protein G4228_016125 [Cervus hanglu yarkandensis]